MGLLVYVYTAADAWKYRRATCRYVRQKTARYLLASVFELLLPVGTYESAGCDYHTVWPGLDLYRRDTLSTGWQVVLWLLLGSAVYFVGGVAYGYVKGQRGFDGHPHSRFWRQLPGLFKDGIVWSNKQASRQPVARNANSEIVDGVTVFSGESTKLMANGGSVTYGALQQDNDDNSL